MYAYINAYFFIYKNMIWYTNIEGCKKIVYIIFLLNVISILKSHKQDLLGHVWYIVMHLSKWINSFRIEN